MDLFRASRIIVLTVTVAILMSFGAVGYADEPKAPATPAAVAPPKASDIPAKPAPAEGKPAALPKTTISAKKEGEGILGKQVYSADGADMGLVTNVLVDHAGNPIGVVIDFGGFLGVGTRKIAVGWRLVQFHPGNKEKPMTLNLEKNQLKSAPTYDPDKPPRIVDAPPPEPPTNPAATAAPKSSAAPVAAPATPNKDTSAHPASTTPTATAPKDNSAK